METGRNRTKKSMSCRQIGDRIAQWAPPALAEPWDNVGWMFGDPDMELKGVLVCLDLTEARIHEAERSGLNLIVTHHPPVFTSIRSVTSDTWVGRMSGLCWRMGMAVYSAHTNFDAAPGGLTDMLARELSLVNPQPFPGPGCAGLEGRGRVGELSSGMTAPLFCHMIASRLKTDMVRCIGPEPDAIRRVVVQNGAYDRDLLPTLVADCPDALVTGDVKHHDALALAEAGLFVVDAGHQATERIFCAHVSRVLAEAFPDYPVCMALEPEVYRIP